MSYFFAPSVLASLITFWLNFSAPSQGSNFLIRARALGEAGWFPTNSVTEDYELGILLTTLGWRYIYRKVSGYQFSFEGLLFLTPCCGLFCVLTGTPVNCRQLLQELTFLCTIAIPASFVIVYYVLQLLSLSFVHGTASCLQAIGEQMSRGLPIVQQICELLLLDP